MLLKKSKIQTSLSFLGYFFIKIYLKLKFPNRVLPLSIFMGLGVVIIIYLFANVAYFTLLTPREMIASSAVAFVITPFTLFLGQARLEF